MGVGFWYNLITQHMAIQMESNIADERQRGKDWE